MQDAITLRWTGVDSRPRRITLEPRADFGYTRIEERWNGSEWCHVGQEIVADVGLEAPAAVIHGDETVLGR